MMHGGGTAQFAAVPLNLIGKVRYRVDAWTDCNRSTPYSTLCFPFILIFTQNSSSTNCADYFVTGEWSQKAQKEASNYLKVNAVFQPKLEKFTSWV
jgi:phosphoserine aminotransferase